MKPLLSRTGALVLLVAGSMGAQTYQGRILGTVRDSSSGVIVGANVAVKNIAKGVSRDLITNGAGEYVASALEPGLYEVAAESPGFKKTVSDRVHLEVAQNLRIDLQLEPGEISQSVTVREVPIVDTATTILGGTLNNKEINDLPVLGRDFQNLVMLRPGLDRTPGGGGFPSPPTATVLRITTTLWMERMTTMPIGRRRSSIKKACPARQPRTCPWMQFRSSAPRNTPRQSTGGNPAPWSISD